MVSRRGFTLLELIVAMAIIVILALVGAAGLASVNTRQQRNVARADIESVAQSQLRFASLYDTFTDFPADLTGIASLPSGITTTAAPARTTRVVSIALGSKGGLGLASRGTDASCWYRYVPPLGSVGSGTAWSIEKGAVCEGRAAFPDNEYPLVPAVPAATRRNSSILNG
jgi:prepilin-type N-terminal cleavage/methylation domain-containing protein